MAIPTHEDLLQGATTWRLNHLGIMASIAYHGYSAPDPNAPYAFIRDGHPGTWAFYLHIPEQMFPHRWGDFKITMDAHNFQRHGSAFNYVDFYGAITFTASEPYFCRKTAKMWDAAKVGCDYNHAWDHEAGYPDTLESVKGDVKEAINSFLAGNPDRLRQCAYTGRWDVASQFYVAKNEALVHNDAEEAATRGGAASLWARSTASPVVNHNSPSGGKDRG